MDIIVSHVRLVDKGNLKAFASIAIDNVLTIHDCRIVQQVGQKAWVSLPQREYQIDGVRKYAPIVEVERNSPTHRRIEQVILAAWEATRKNGEGADDDMF